MTDGDARILRLTARRTWRFFETFVTAADHMLPPDNFQEDPAPVLAHRTSPTNIGLYLLSTGSARAFGGTGTIDAPHRLEAPRRAVWTESPTRSSCPARRRAVGATSAKCRA